MTNVATNALPTLKKTAHLPGDTGVWMFVIGDMVIFSAYFSAYIFDRMHNHELFMHSQHHLSQGIGVINTLILLTSSLFVALSVHALRANDVRIASRFLTAGGIFGAAFLFLKSYEWYLKLRAGITTGTNSFFMHYYMMTGIHFFHVMLGLSILFMAWCELNFSRTSRIHFLEISATYWHMVDFLWIIIFSLVYLMR